MRRKNISAEVDIKISEFFLVDTAIKLSADKLCQERYNRKAAAVAFHYFNVVH